MNWQEVLTILVPLLTLLGWVYLRLEKRFDKIDERFEKIDTRFEKIDTRFEKIDTRFEKMEVKMENGFRDLQQEISGIKDRVARIEGHLTSPFHWEPKIKGEE